MKRFHSLLIILTVVAITLFTSLGQCEDTKSERHWYRLEIQTGESTYQCFGSSTLDETEFAKHLAEPEFISFDDASYLDASGKIKSWQEWDPQQMHPRLYVNPEYVIFFYPLKGDPRGSSATKPVAGKQ
jgi:hypothetical protein